MASLPSLSLALRDASAGTSAAQLLLRDSWTWARQATDRAFELSSPSHREQLLSELSRPLAAILESASLIDAADVRDEAIAALCRQDQPVGCAIAVLRSTVASRSSAAGLDAIASHCSGTLMARLALPARASDDWSIQLPTGCDCELCGNLRAFLQDPARTRLEWPLAKDRRRHVHARIDTAELPVDHHTRRVGRPYTLILTKTDALFKREAQDRGREERDLRPRIVDRNMDRSVSMLDLSAQGSPNFTSDPAFVRP